MAEKIRITWGDVTSAAVDEQLRRQEALTRTTEHYQQHAASPGMQMSPGAAMSHGAGRPANLLYNSLVYMTLFGVLGGCIAWPPAELSHQVFGRYMIAFQDYLSSAYAIEEQHQDGEISEAEAQSRTAELDRQYADNPYVAIVTNKTLSDEEKDTRFEEVLAEESTGQFIGTLLFCALGGICIATSLSVAEPLASRNVREAVINGSVGLCLGMIGGIFVGLFIDTIYQALGGGGGAFGLIGQVIARSVGWGILGLFLSIAPGVVMRSPKKLAIGLAGGLIGGAIGGLMFDAISIVTQVGWVSRLVGLTVIGTVAGLGTGLIENVAKTGWVRIVGGLLTGKQFILYKLQTHIGSSPECEIYLFKDPQVASRHAVIRRTGQGCEIQDLNSPTGVFVNQARVQRARLRNNDKVQIGDTTFAFHEKGR